MTPIGSSIESFSGSFDTDNFVITDWTFQNASKDHVGFFGYVSSALIQNFSLERTWVIFSGSNCGFLVGTMVASSDVYSISSNFSSGSITSPGYNIEGLIGSGTGSVLAGLTLKGVLSSISGADNVGRLVGSLSSSANLNYA